MRRSRLVRSSARASGSSSKRSRGGQPRNRPTRALTDIPAVRANARATVPTSKCFTDDPPDQPVGGEGTNRSVGVNPAALRFTMRSGLTRRPGGGDTAAMRWAAPVLCGVGMVAGCDQFGESEPEDAPPEVAQPYNDDADAAAEVDAAVAAAGADGKRVLLVF